MIQLLASSHLHQRVVLFLEFDQNAKEILDQIRETGQLADEDEMKQAVESFKKTFVPTQK